MIYQVESIAPFWIRRLILPFVKVNHIDRSGRKWKRLGNQHYLIGE